MTQCTRTKANGSPCGGTMDDGFCDRCGKPPEGVSVVNAATGAAATATVRSVATYASGATRSTGTVGGTGSTTGRTGRHTSRRHTKGSTSRRQTLGGGLVSLPPMPSQAPMDLVMAKPEVSPGKRRCPSCQTRVNRVKGFCPKCGSAYDFAAKLKPGDVVAGKYEVKGAIAFGGLGWVYLGWDQVLSRWVVLKGLLNSKDEEAMAAAMAERQFLADVKHGRIVGIYDFVQQGAEGYMVLEYVGGRTLESLRDERGPLPPAEAIAYVLGILPAFGYLHGRGFVYCDFKPGNLMLENDDVKLIDMGAVRRIGDPDGAVFATDGYAAKEAGDEPSVVSDLYTVGRTLAVLLMDFLWASTTDTDPATGQVTTTRRMRSAFKNALPSPTEQKVLAEHESLHRFLLRACAEDPDERFQSAEEMEGQLYGVLRQVVSRAEGPKPADSKVFLGDGLTDGRDREGAAAPLVRCLPTLRVDLGDKAAALVSSALAITNLAAREAELCKAARKHPGSPEVAVRMADARLEAGDAVAARTIAEGILARDEFEWRGRWALGKAILALGDPARALESFEKVYAEMPGELAPMVACGFAAEAAKNVQHAAKRYWQVVATDPGYASACFGLARTAPYEAKTALGAVPTTHALRQEAQATLAEGYVSRLEGKPVGGVPAIIHAAEVAGGAVVNAAPGPRRSGIAGRLYSRVAELIEGGAIAIDADRKLGDTKAEPRALRTAAEAAYRDAARFATDAGERERLVDAANATRAWSMT